MSTFSLILPVNVDLEFYRGDFTAVSILFWSDPEKTQPVNLDQFDTLVLEIKKRRTSSFVVEALTLGDGLSLTTTPNELLIALSSERADILGVYQYDLQGRFTGTSNDVTLIEGSMNFFNDVTRE